MNQQQQTQQIQYNRFLKRIDSLERRSQMCSNKMNRLQNKNRSDKLRKIKKTNFDKPKHQTHSNQLQFKRKKLDSSNVSNQKHRDKTLNNRLLLSSQEIFYEKDELHHDEMHVQNKILNNDSMPESDKSQPQMMPVTFYKKSAFNRFPQEDHHNSISKISDQNQTSSFWPWNYPNIQTNELSKVQPSSVLDFKLPKIVKNTIIQFKTEEIVKIKEKQKQNNEFYICNCINLMCNNLKCGCLKRGIRCSEKCGCIHACCKNFGPKNHRKHNEKSVKKMNEATKIVEADSQDEQEINKSQNSLKFQFQSFESSDSDGCELFSFAPVNFMQEDALFFGSTQVKVGQIGEISQQIVHEKSIFSQNQRISDKVID